MSNLKRNSIFVTLFIVVLVGLVGFSWHRAQAAEAASQPANTRHLQFDIAEIGTRFVFDEAPVFDDGFPAYGNAFVTEGYIYEAGTLGRKRWRFAQWRTRIS